MAMDGRGAYVPKAGRANVQGEARVEQPVGQPSADGPSSAAQNAGPKSKAGQSEQKSKADKEQKKAEKDRKKEDRKDKRNAFFLMKGAKGVADAGMVGGKMAAGASKFSKAVSWFKDIVAKFVAFVKNAAVFIAGSALGGLMLWAGLQGDNPALRDDWREDCVVYINKGAIGNDASAADPDLIRMQLEKRIYSVLFYYGMRPEQIFGVLGNWSHESGIDPTSVETVFDEPYKLGYWKRQAVELDFCPEFHGQKLMDDYFSKYPSIQRVGIGLGQWTNERNSDLLRYAQEAGKQRGGSDVYYDQDVAFQWYDLDIQLAYMLDTSSMGDSKASWIKDWSENGLVSSSAQKRSEEDSLEFRGDKPANSVYGEVECIGNNEEDPYYDGLLPLEDGSAYSDQTCRGAAEESATHLCDEYRHAGKYNVYDDDGHVTIDEEAYKKDFAKFYRYSLYENMVRKYTYEFLTEWEGINNGTYPSRVEKALELFHQWYGVSHIEDAGTQEPNKTAGDTEFFKVEEGYGYSVLSIAERTKNVSLKLWNLYDTNEDMSNCRQVVKSTAGLSLAQSAATIAWPTAVDSRDNNGTELYQYIHDIVLEGDTIYRSCDRTVCTAVRWSGYDDEFPAGPTLTTMQHLTASPRWTELNWGGDINQLQPGDILIKKDSVAQGSDDEEPGDAHHVVMYIGQDTAKMYWNIGLTDADKSKCAAKPLEGSCVVHGSYDDRSPAIDVWHDTFNDYHAFRCTSPQREGTGKWAGYSYQG